MAIGYNIIQPNGTLKKIRVDERCRSASVQQLLEQWGSYCDKNWISENHNDPFCPEHKVKLFLNGLAYFLQMGNTEGMVTDYKAMVNGKREIPISSCPSYIEDMVYGGGVTIANQSQDEAASFNQMLLESLDSHKKGSKKKRPPSNYSIKRNKLKQIRGMMGECEFEYAVVNTDNEFSYGGEKYVIDSSVTQYGGKMTAEGVLYDMDHIICVRCLSNGNVLFCDTNIDVIPAGAIHLKK